MKGGKREGAGRKPGVSNQRTRELIALAGQGIAPVTYLLTIVTDETKGERERIEAAKAAAPYVHPKPAPLGEIVTIRLPSVDTAEGTFKAATAILVALSEGAISLAAGRDLMAMIDMQRKNIELVDIEARLAALEHKKAGRK